jgi:hypothetical protein
LNVDAMIRNPIDFLKEDEDFGCDVMEQKDQPKDAPSPTKIDSTNEVFMNVFTLQHINQKTNDDEAHLARNESDGQNVDSFSNKELPPMNLVEYIRMVVEVQNMVDEAKGSHKNKSVETVV